MVRSSSLPALSTPKVDTEAPARAFLTLTEAARELRLGHRTIRAAIDAGELRTAPVCTSSIRIARAELERWAVRRAS